MAFLGASVALTGTMRLAATDAERRDIGGALSDALAFFDDTSPFVTVLNILGPWSGVIDGLAKAIYDRIVYVAQHRAGKVPTPSPEPPPRVDPTFGGTNGRARVSQEDDEIYAPDPGAGRFG